MQHICLKVHRRIVNLCRLFAMLIVLSTTAQAEDARPNILVFMAEDLGMRVGAFGDAIAVTPAIDKLAERGVRYSNAFTTAGVCAPSRAAHVMGTHQIAFGAQHMRTSAFKESPYRSVPPPDLKAYPELLRQASYFTFTVRKLDYQFSAYAPGSGPFTIWDREPRSLDLQALDPQQPFFGLVNLPQTHESQIFDENVEKNRSDGRQQLISPDDVIVPAYYPDTRVVRAAIARQYDNVAAMDDYVAEVLEQFHAHGLLENTIIVWTTDHGDGLPRAKRELYDSGIHVPLVIVWPSEYRPEGVEPGQVDERLVSFVDLGPSFLTLAGVPVPESMGGHPVLVDAAAQREFVFAAKDRLDEHRFRERAVRDKRYKYIRNMMPGRPGATHLAYRDRLGIMTELWKEYEEGRMTPQQAAWFEPRPAEELYDTLADPDEVQNLAAEPAYAGVLARMRIALDAWLARTGDRAEQAEADMAREFWPGGEQPVTPAPAISECRHGVVMIEPAVAGASIGYRVDRGPWLAYAPGTCLEIPAGATLITKSVRYGWAESPEVSREF
jgi:arylsulfatase A-like enzyme